MNFMATNWYWILVILALVGFYVFRQGQSTRRGQEVNYDDRGQSGEDRGNASQDHSEAEEERTGTDSRPPRYAGHRHHGGCC